MGLAAVLCACGGKAVPEVDASAAPAAAEGPERSAAIGALAKQLTAPGAPHGTVLEKLDASSYSYLRLRTEAGEIWAAVPQTDVAIGAEVTIANATAMDGFESQTLGRRFDQILFGTLEGQSATPGAAGLPPGHVPVSAPMAGAAEPIAVEKATGADARTVAEIHAERTALAGKPVTVRAQVVKFTPGIMGKNWLHVRDGSGSDAAEDNDLTVTTQGSVRVGDVVVVSGSVSVDRDFGAGYAYKVIIEDATVTPTQRAGM